MTKLDAGGVNALTAQCFVCEKAFPAGECFTRVKYADQTILLCSQRCADAFHGQRMPLMRRIEALAALQPAQGPYSQAFSPLNDW